MSRNLLSGLCGLALLVVLPLHVASAADMAVKAPPAAAPAAPAADWTGFYVDAGVGWQSEHFNWAYTNFVPAEAPFTLSGSGGSIAGHFGFQQQFSWLVVGAEVGLFTSMKGNQASIIASGNPAGPCGELAGTLCVASTSSADLVGGKVGVDWGNWLVYGVGGGVFDTSIATHLAAVSFDSGQPNTTHGWYAGGGLDYLFYKSRPIDVIAGVEYQHVRLDTVAECSAGAVAVVGGCPGTDLAAARLVSATEDSVWAKLTVKWNPEAP